MGRCGSTRSPWSSASVRQPSQEKSLPADLEKVRDATSNMHIPKLQMTVFPSSPLRYKVKT